MSARKSYSETLLNLRDELVLYCEQAWDVAEAMRMSDAQSFFSRKAFEGWKKARERDVKLQVAIIEHIASVLGGLRELAKALHR